MDNLHTLQRLQGELNEEMHRLTLLRDVFQAQHCADELDAASHLEAAHIAHCSARRSSQRIRELQSLVALLRHGGPPPLRRMRRGDPHCPPYGRPRGDTLLRMPAEH